LGAAAKERQFISPASFRVSLGKKESFDVSTAAAHHHHHYGSAPYWNDLRDGKMMNNVATESEPPGHQWQIQGRTHPWTGKFIFLCFSAAGRLRWRKRSVVNHVSGITAIMQQRVHAILCFCHFCTLACKAAWLINKVKP
jgi:hypothetical protein